MADEGTKTDPAQAFQNLLDKHNNDALKLASQLFDDNFHLRTKNRELTDRQPKEGSVVLSAEEAKKWNAFNELGQEPKDLKKAIERLPQLEKDNKELSSAESLREVSALFGWKYDVLKKAASVEFPDAQISFKEEKDKDKNVRKVPYISLDGKESSLEAFANEIKLTDTYALKAADVKPIKQGIGGDPNPQDQSRSIFDRIRENAKKQSENAAKPADLNARFGIPTA